MNKFLLFICLFVLVSSDTVQRYKHPLTILRCFLQDTDIRKAMITFVEAFKTGQYLDIFVALQTLIAKGSACYDP